MARYDGSPSPVAIGPGAPGPAQADPSLVSGQDPPSIFGIPLNYSTGMPGSQLFNPRGEGPAQDTAEGPPLGEVIVTIPGASSVPAQPVASVGAWDTNTQQQGVLYGSGNGRETLSGADNVGKTGIGGGHASHQLGGAA